MSTENRTVVVARDVTRRYSEGENRCRRAPRHLGEVPRGA